MRWPIMTKAAHEAELRRIIDLMQSAVDREYIRATNDGKAKVHAWARDANYEIFQVSGGSAKAVAIAAFQVAEHQFGPEPLTLSDVLYAPANVKEAMSRAQ